MDKETLKKFGELIIKSPLLSLLDKNPDNHPSIIYKYRNWKDDFHKNLLIKNEIFMAPPSLLNDPFDCRIYENHLKYLNNTEQIEKYISQSLINNSQYLKDNKINKLHARKILSKKLEDILHYQIRTEVISQEIDDKHIGITCFSEKWDSLLMWSHYGDNHNGYCVGFDEKSLRYSGMFGKLKRVKYSDIYPELDPLNKVSKLDEVKYYQKSKAWEYESEIRAMKLFFDNKSNRILTLFDNNIKEVVIGLNTPQNNRKEIIEIAKARGIQVWQTIKSDFEFKIERYEI